MVATRDLAKLYATDTKRINEAVNRNQEKFYERFSWKLTKEELNNLWSQFATANISKKSRSTPRVFTEQGIAMLATVLKTSVATRVTIEIMDAFIMMKKYIGNNLIEQKYINKLVLEDHERIKLLQESFNKLEEKTKYNNLFFEELIKKYNSQYSNIKFINNNSLHDRFIIIDNKILYHCRASFKDLGKKCFGINRIDDKVIVNNIIDNLKLTTNYPK